MPRNPKERLDNEKLYETSCAQPGKGVSKAKIRLNEARTPTYLVKVQAKDKLEGTQKTSYSKLKRSHVFSVSTQVGSCGAERDRESWQMSRVSPVRGSFG